jgi:ABC-type branched-subunit amino acid transport system ATPase component/branched-subunit amino acid ABC-type transport system permease component
VLLTFIILGLAAGAVYGMSGVGLVLTYRTSNVFNFAYGAIGTLAAYLFYSLHVNDHVAWPLAALIAIAGVGVVGGLVFAVIARSLSTAALTMQVAATVGVMLIIQAACTIIYGPNTLNFPSFLPSKSVHFLGAEIGQDRLIVFAVAVVLTVALSSLLRRTRLGISMRAVVQGSTLLSLCGRSPNAVRALAWIIGTAFAAIAGLLIAPSVNLDPEILTLLVVQSYAAAALGLFKNIGWTFAGGLVIGVLSSVTTYYGTSDAFLNDLAPGLPFVILLVVLFVLPRGRLPRPRLIAEKVRKRPGKRVQLAVGIPVAAVLILVPEFAENQLSAYAGGAALAVLFVSLGLLVRESGQVSLAHVGFAAIGAAAFGHLAGEHHLPWGVALVVAGLITVPFGALLAVPAIRHGGLYLALATFGFGLILEETFYAKSFMLGQSSSGLSVPLPGGALVLSNGDYYLILGIAGLIAAGVTLLLTGRLGRFLNAFAQSPIALVTSGLNTTIMQVSVFCFAAFLAGIAGALYGSTLGIATGPSFDPFTSLIYVAVIVIAAGGAPWYAWVAGMAVVLLPTYISGANTSSYLNIMFGVFAIGTALAPVALERFDLQRTIADMTGKVPLARRRQRQGDVAATSGDGGWEAPPPPAAQEVAEQHEPRSQAAVEGVQDILVVRELTVRFGGLVAVNGLNLCARRAAITALIGPNGAGKTTTFNTISGLTLGASGSVELKGRDVMRLGPAHRARLGLGRTFQEMNLFDGLTVFENIAIVGDAQDAGSIPWRQMLPRWRARHAIETRVREIARLCGLGAVLDKPAGLLSTAQRRMVDLARALMASPDMLLLDEPLSGLDVAEGEAVMLLLRRLCEERGMAILVVEHDMDFVVKAADYVYVLDFGRLIFEGDASSLLESDIVRDAYIGTGSDQALEEIA